MSSRRLFLGTLAGVLLSLASMPAALHGQDSGIRWAVGNPKAGFCIHFMVKPDAATRDLVRGQRVVLAREATGLPPALARVLTDQPEFAGWVPAQVCLIYPEAIWVNNKRFDRGDGETGLAVAFWGVSSTGGEAAFSIRSLTTNSAPLKRAMEAVLIPMQRVDIDVRPVTESEDERYTLNLDGAALVLEGSAKTDSVDVEKAPFPSRAALRGLSNTVWNLGIDLKPTRIGTLPGALRVQGGKGLADALLNSPIRFVDKVIAGGTGEIRFTR